MRVAVVYRQDIRNEKPVPCYAASYAREFAYRGHNVVAIGEGHEIKHLDAAPDRDWDLIVEIENGRNAEGQLRFQVPEIDWPAIPPTAVVLIDSHGHPDLHQAVARSYEHVFFAVWDKRDLYAKHASAHWCPNATDLKWFDRTMKTEMDAMLRWENITTSFDFGFFGSKMGLERANTLVEICKQRGWKCDVREVVKAHRHRWPSTAMAMAACRFLFNQGQKHDGPNQRVMESMAMCRPLITDLDERDGMSQLFEVGKHFLGYHKGVAGELEEMMGYLYDNPAIGQEMAERAYQEVCEKHLIGDRVDQILGVVG